MAYASGVLFDVDGTLVDTTYLHTTSWWHAFREYGYQVPMASIHPVIGMGADKIVERLLPAERDRDLDQRIADAHLALQATYWDRLQPLPGAAELLRGCRAVGVRVVLASSATGRELEALRRALDADDVIDACVGMAEGVRSKPDPDILEVALHETGLNGDEVVDVGDSLWDVHAASKLDIPCIALKSGGTCESALRDAGAVAVYRDPQALLEELDRSAIARRM
jgi:HAD superfamily hydrolase (TIGR01509 family)